MPTVFPSAQHKPDTSDDGGRKLTGLHVLLILLAFFGITASVDGVMIHYALSTFRGEVVSHPYEKGLAYNSTIKEAREQEARGWKVDGTVKRAGDGKARIEVDARDAAGAPLAGLKMRAILAAPADMKRDRSVDLVDLGGGLYRADLATPAGAWDFELTAARDGKTLFQSRNRITLR